MTVVGNVLGPTVGSTTARIDVLEYTIDIASNGAVASVDTTVTATGEVLAGDEVLLLRAPAAIAAGIAFQTCHTVVADSFKLRSTNPSAGAVDPASGTYRFLRIRF